MAEKLYYHDINGLGVAELLGMRVQNVADATAQTTVETTGNNGAALGTANVGYIIYREDLDQLGIWDGTQFNFQSVSLTGDVIFKGTLNASLAIDDVGQPQPIEAVAGHQYVVSTAGTFNPGATGVTLNGNQELQVGDMVLFTSATEAYAIQRNDVLATDTVTGNVRLATQTEVDNGATTGTDPAVVTPETLDSKLSNRPVAFTATVNLTGNSVADTVNHALNLVNQNAFTINLMHSNSQVSIDVDSVDINNITLTSLLPLTGVVVTIMGIVA